MTSLSDVAGAQRLPTVRATAKIIARRIIPAVDRIIGQRDKLVREAGQLRTDIAATRAELANLQQELDRQRLSFAIGRFIGDATCEIETEAAPAQLDAMLSRIQEAWRAFGETEPYWSVLTHEAYLTQNIAKNIASFHENGESEVAERALPALSRNHVDVSKIRRVLDYGCGVGRLTIPLARRFPSVLAIDVSEKHIAHARRYAADYGLKNIDFVKMENLQQLDAVAGVDFIFSIIVLQHNPPPVIAAMLRKLLHALNPGGCALFQVPTYCKNYRFSCAGYLANPSSEMEMHAIPQRAALAIARECGCDILEVREDGLAGMPPILSHTFLVQKST